MPSYGQGFLHRDFHPGNVLWSGRTAHVVDWANACSGPWGCDVAHCRSNLIDLVGSGRADDFLRAYLELTGATYDPFWEIASVLEQGHLAVEDVVTAEARLAPAVAACSG